MVLISTSVISWVASSADLGVTGNYFLRSLFVDMRLIYTLPELNYFVMEPSFILMTD
jgi:hypothetical protein